MALCIYNCGDETSNHDGVCGRCATRIFIDGHPKHMTREEFDNFVRERIVGAPLTAPADKKVGAQSIAPGRITRIDPRLRGNGGEKPKENKMKICIGYIEKNGQQHDCGKEFEPTSGPQKRCPECRKLHVSPAFRSGRKNGGGALFLEGGQDAEAA
jgi:hypothetical protein